MANNILDIDALNKIYPCDRSQIEHRVNIVSGWSIPPGSRVLEVGPGQGDCTVVLAAAVGEQGHVDAVDPAPLDYGSPMTIGTSQAHLSASSLGPRITWIHAEPLTHLSTPPSRSEDRYTHIVFFHSLWYFDQSSDFPAILHLLPAHVTADATLCIVEYALKASSLNAVPHVLAALAHAEMEAVGGVDVMRNVKNVNGSEWAKEVSGKEGWIVKEERVVVPPKGLEDGKWEVGTVVGRDFGAEVEVVAGREERIGGVLRGMRQAVIGAVEELQGGLEEVETMSVWAAKMVRGGSSTS